MIRHETHSTPDGNTIISATCFECLDTKKLTVKTSGYDAWVKGALIQNAMPDLPEDDREILISGQCGKCFDALFSDDDESGEE